MSKNTTIGPFGFPMPDKLARVADEALSKMPKDVRERFKTTVKDANGKLVEVEGYARRMYATKAPDLNDGEHADVSVITSDSVDRDKEVVLPRGLDFSQFQKNPVVTFCHNYSTLPVGKCLWVKMESMAGGGECWKAKTKYAPRPAGDLLPTDEEWLPDIVWHYVKEGYMPGKSIGFIPLAYRDFTPDEIRANPAWADATWGVIPEAIVLEYAVCPVQANPDALVESVAKMRAKGIIGKCLTDALGLIVPDVVVVETKKEEHKPKDECVCRDCGAKGSATDEFTSLHTGRCKKCEDAAAKKTPEIKTFVKPETIAAAIEQKALASLSGLGEQVKEKLVDRLFREMGRV